MNKILLAMLAFVAVGFGQTPRIIGGTEAPADAYPWAVRITFAGNLLCTGTLVSPTLVLTAGHCTQDTFGVNYTASTYSLRVGGNTLSTGTVVGASRVIPHPRYRFNAPQGQLKNDIALIELATPVTQTPVQVAAFAIPDNTLSRAIGWGITTNSATGTATSRLMHTDVTTVDRATCATAYSNAGYIEADEFQFCATGQAATGQGTCSGDSGGPLVADYDGTWLLFGATQGGIQYCDQPNEPGIYTSVFNYREFLLANGVPLKKLKAGVLTSIL